MKKIQHTPTPYYSGPFSGVNSVGIKTIGPGWERHMFFANLSGAYNGNSGIEQAKADAAFIVQAVNAHDALVEALKAVHEAGRMSENSRAKYMAEIAEKALKLAGAA